MTPSSLLLYGQSIKDAHNACVDRAIEEALRLIVDAPGASEDIMCQYADQAGDDFKFELLDFVQDNRPATVPQAPEGQKHR